MAFQCNYSWIASFVFRILSSYCRTNNTDIIQRDILYRLTETQAVSGSHIHAGRIVDITTKAAGQTSRSLFITNVVQQIRIEHTNGFPVVGALWSHTPWPPAVTANSHASTALINTFATHVETLPLNRIFYPALLLFDCHHVFLTFISLPALLKTWNSEASLC